MKTQKTKKTQRSLELTSSKLLLALIALLAPALTAQTPAPIRVAIVGLNHDHVRGFFYNLAAHPEITVVGISEPNAALRQTYITRTHLPANLFFPTEAAMLAATHPQAILVYTSIAEHRAAIEQAAPLHIAAMVEKPLATTVEDALAIQAPLAEIQRPRPHQLRNHLVQLQHRRRQHARRRQDRRPPQTRHPRRPQGPKEIGVGPEFLAWLTDPKQNGAGALFDFGCYGVDLSTWILHGELPLTVTAVTLHLKPQIYPNVDDDSTIVLTYPHAQAIIQGSWNWPFSRKDMEIYGATGYIDTLYDDHNPGAKLRIRLPGEATEHVETAPALAPPQDNSLNYLAAVLRGTLKPDHDLTSLDTNVTVVRILDAARRSAQTGRTIRMDASKQ